MLSSCPARDRKVSRLWSCAPAESLASDGPKSAVTRSGRGADAPSSARAGLWRRLEPQHDRHPHKSGPSVELYRHPLAGMGSSHRLGESYVGRDGTTGKADDDVTGGNPSQVSRGSREQAHHQGTARCGERPAGPLGRSDRDHFDAQEGLRCADGAAPSQSGDQSADAGDRDRKADVLRGRVSASCSPRLRCSCRSPDRRC